MPPVTIPDPETDQLEPGVPVSPEEVAIGTDLAPAPTPTVPPLIMRGPQSPTTPPTGPPLQLLTPEQSSQQEMMRRAQYAYAADPTAQTEAAVAAALRFQAQRQYQQDLAAGTAPAEALAKVAPLLFAGPKQGNLGQAASFIKATRTPVQKPIDVGGVLYRQNPDGSVTPLTLPKRVAQPRPVVVQGVAYRQNPDGSLVPITQATPKLSETEKALLAADVTELKGLEKQIGSTEEHGFGVLHPFGGNKAQVDALRQKAAALRRKIQTEYGGKAKTDTIPNAPRVAKDRVAGQTYQTPKGPHTWTGTGWKVANEPAAPESAPATSAADDTEEESNAE